MAVSKPGTYILIFRSPKSFTARVGKLGDIDVPAGYCAYVGSAFGPGGLQARISRHRKRGKPQHWHLDYLRDRLDLVEIWYSTESRKLECQWSEILRTLGGVSPASGLGASDCRCQSHFFCFEQAPELSHFVSWIPEGIPLCRDTTIPASAA